MSMYKPSTKEEIVKRLKKTLKEELNNQTSTVSLTFNSDMIEANGIEFQKTSTEIAMALDAAFAPTSWGEYLDMIASEEGLERKQATKAGGYVTVKGDSGAQIIKGSLFATVNDGKFYTLEDAVIGPEGTVRCKVEAGESGAAGNVEPETIIQIPMSIPGVVEVTNENETTGGYDEESDAALLERYYIKVRMPAVSGNRYHYLQWALEVPGVGSAKVFPVWSGPGTVKVTIVDSNNESADEALIKATYDHIEEQRPIGATVTVATAIAREIDVSAKTEGEADVEAFEELLTAYFKSIGFKDTKVSIAKIGKLLLETAGVRDYDDLMICGQAENIELGEEEFPAVGRVTLRAA